MNLLETANKWKDLGVVTLIGKYVKELNRIKIIDEPREIRNTDTDESILKDGYDVLILEISDSPIFCIDVDNVNESIKKFHELLESNNTSIDHFIYEKTRNGGYHIYFRSSERYKNIMGKSYCGIGIDILMVGRIFTSPSSFNGKKYTFGKIKLEGLNSINDIGEIPEWLDELLCNPDYPI